MTEKKDSICDEIIAKIIKNRISTTEIADCLEKTGVLNDVKALNKGHFKVGKIFLAYGYNGSNWEIHEQIQDIPENVIVVVETHNCDQKAVFGELVSKYLLLYKGASAVVTTGYMRDAHWLLKENFPVWCKGVTPIGCMNQKNEKEIDSDVLKEWKEKYDGAIAVCDDGGVVIIQKEHINEEFLKKLDFIELQEDIWRYCMNTKKWSTYETVCLKKYLETDPLPKELRQHLTILSKRTKKDSV